VKITIKLGELFKYDWIHACEVLGLNEWCINEGLADENDEITLTEEQAKEIGISFKEAE
jgi:hypothetical protein